MVGEQKRFFDKELGRCNWLRINTGKLSSKV